MGEELSKGFSGEKECLDFLQVFCLRECSSVLTSTRKVGSSEKQDMREDKPSISPHEDKPKVEIDKKSDMRGGEMWSRVWCDVPVVGTKSHEHLSSILSFLERGFLPLFTSPSGP